MLAPRFAGGQTEVWTLNFVKKGESKNVCNFNHGQQQRNRNGDRALFGGKRSSHLREYARLKSRQRFASSGDREKFIRRNNPARCEDLRDVVLVGHSYGGMVIAGVAERAAERLAHLVYLDAFVPGDGQSLADFQPPEVLAMFHEKTRTEGDGYKLPSFPAEVFGVTNEDDLAWVKPRLNPHPLKTKLDAVRLTNPKAAEIPRTYIYCNNPAVGPFGQFAERLRCDESWQYMELATGHDAMITKPKKLADLLLEITTTSFCATTDAV